MRVSRAAFRDALAKTKARKERRAEKVAENAALAGEAVINQEAQNRPKSAPGGVRTPVRGSGQRPRGGKRRKKSLFVRLRDALDRECQAFAAARDSQLGCRIRKAAQCSGRSEVGYHIIPRGKWAVRWDLDFMGTGNLVGSCSPCNAGENWHRLDYAEHHKTIFGQDFYAALWQKSHSKTKYSSLELQRMLDEVRKRRADLKSRPSGPLTSSASGEAEQSS